MSSSQQLENISFSSSDFLVLVKNRNRYSIFLLNSYRRRFKRISENVASLKSKTKLCKDCFNFTEKEVCEICEIMNDHSIILVVETV